MKLTFCATNPCHMWDMARALHKRDALAAYHSGYPRWRLRGADHSLPVRTHSLRTLITYSLLKLPPALRPSNRRLFPWQDEWFDRQTARALQPCSMVHAMPGQCLETFRRARAMGIPTVLNHATGPAERLQAILNEEREKEGLPPEVGSHYDHRHLSRITEETKWADYHCVASEVVADQLAAEGVEARRIMVVPYAADPTVFFPPERRESFKGRFLFAGHVTLRKGFHTLLRALELAERPDWTLDVFGAIDRDGAVIRNRYRGKTPVNFHGPISQQNLAEKMRSADALILPSLEEGFGLVVPQALACGCPCLVSDAVGAKDLVVPGVNGSIFAVGSPVAVAEALETVAFSPSADWPLWSWEDAAERLVQKTGKLPSSENAG